MIKEAIVKIVNKEELTYDEAYTCLLYTSHSVLHRMLRGGGGQLHGDPRHSAAIGDVLPRYQVVAILYSTGQIVGDVLNGGQRDGFTQDIYAVRHHDFRIVEQRVKALIGLSLIHI